MVICGTQKLQSRMSRLKLCLADGSDCSVAVLKTCDAGRVSITREPFPRKPMYKQLETGHLVSAQMGGVGAMVQRARSTVTPRLAKSRLETHAVCL